MCDVNNLIDNFSVIGNLKLKKNGNLRNSAIVPGRERNPIPNPSQSLCLASEIKEELSSKINKSLDQEIQSIKRDFPEDEWMKELKN